MTSDKLAAHESYHPAGYSRFRRWAIPMVAAALSAALVWGVLRVQNRGNDNVLVAEAVNDHLRIISSSHPVEIESGGIHQVKPWFTGRLDFAPRMSFSGDDEFPLLGGSVGYLLDRKAAVFVFKCRLHTITLLVFPSTRLTWPTSRPVRLGAEDGAKSRAGGSMRSNRSGAASMSWHGSVPISDSPWCLTSTAPTSSNLPPASLNPEIPRNQPTLSFVAMLEVPHGIPT
jgi:anti-sigma factor RsiW